jgi:NitT/TauT family transport system ATP-binding protein
MTMTTAETKVAGLEPALRYEGVGHTFHKRGTSFLALKDVELSINPGEFVSLVGPSGCGKSTLLRISAGLLRASQGRAWCQGDPIHEPRRDVGLMLQTPTLFPWRTVDRNITLPLEIAGVPKASYQDRLGEVLELVGLTEFRNRLPHELSGGMQQRVALCRLLIGRYDVMLLDEPFGALDEFTREHLNVELARISEHDRKTTLFVTHNIEESVFLSDRIVVMTNNPGRVVTCIDIDLPRPRTPAIRLDPEFTGKVNEIRTLFGLS